MNQHPETKSYNRISNYQKQLHFSTLLLRACKDTLGISQKEIKSKKRNREFQDARAAMCFLLSQETDNPIPKNISFLIGRKRSSYYDYIHNHKNWYETNAAYTQTFNTLKQAYETLKANTQMPNKFDLTATGKSLIR